MYFSSNATGGFQIWRQAVPDGTPEQVTFGPTEAEGLAVSPDGRSLYTSIGLSRQTVNVHVDGRDRPVSGEGDATLPMWGDGFPTSLFSADGTKLFYLVRSGQASGRGFGGGELWSSDLARGTREAVLPGLFVTSFDLSPDGQTIVFAATDNGHSHIWLSRLDRRFPPKLLVPGEALGPVFGGRDDVYFRAPREAEFYLFRIAIGSGEVTQFTTEQAVNSPIITPDRRAVVSVVPASGTDATTVTRIFPVDGSAATTLCTSCSVKWTRDGRSLFFQFGLRNGIGEGKTFIFALRPGQMFPDVPPGGYAADANLATSPSVELIKQIGVFPGPSRSEYAYQQTVVQRNIYRVRLD
jgi:hypothetical protein